MTATVLHGDCLTRLAELPDNSVDAIVTDPPYGLTNTTPKLVADTITRWISGDRAYLPSKRGFMGAEWDGFVPPVAVWDECLRVLKPGGHILVFSGSRTVDLMGIGVRLAGFDVRDQLQWLYGSGFPKGMDVSKAVDQQLGAKREKVRKDAGYASNPAVIGSGKDGLKGGTRPYIEAAKERGYHEVDSDVPATPEAEAWQGWGTALKPGHEPIIMARKPITGTVAANVLEHGTGALNIDGCRTVMSEDDRQKFLAGQAAWKRHAVNGGQTLANGDVRKHTNVYGDYGAGSNPPHEKGRWPANVMFDEDAAEALNTQAGSDVSRFFYIAKASPAERPVYFTPTLMRLRSDLTPEQVDHVKERLREAGVAYE